MALGRATVTGNESSYVLKKPLFMEPKEKELKKMFEYLEMILSFAKKDVKLEVTLCLGRVFLMILDDSSVFVEVVTFMIVPAVVCSVLLSYPVVFL